ncbi:MAG TPA: hypothetical protein VJ550_04115 [Geomonas sp.]|nr:hypothetical protein [Geomonas sp.]
MDQRSLVMGENRIRAAVRTYHDLQSCYQKIVGNFAAQFSDLEENFQCQLDSDHSLTFFDGTRVTVSFDYITNHTETLMGMISFARELKNDECTTLLTLFFDEHGSIGTTPIRGEGIIGFDSKILCRSVMRELLEAHLKSKHKVPAG